MELDRSDTGKAGTIRFRRRSGRKRRAESRNPLFTSDIASGRRGQRPEPRRRMAYDNGCPPANEEGEAMVVGPVGPWHLSGCIVHPHRVSAHSHRNAFVL